MNSIHMNQLKPCDLLISKSSTELIISTSKACDGDEPISDWVTITTIEIDARASDSQIRRMTVGGHCLTAVYGYVILAF